MIRLEIKNSNMILTEKLQKYRHCNQVKLPKTNILKETKCYLLIKLE